jgi:DNA-directed RNA polymerase specialized sigma24 family protein
LANGSAVNDVAKELLKDVMVETLSLASRFQLDRQPKAWLLGIAANLVKRWQTAVASG